MHVRGIKMIEKTVFTNEEIIDVMKTNYNIAVDHVEKLNQGSANLYSLNGNKYILKEFQSTYTMREIDNEIAMINRLREDNIPVPEYVKTLNGDYSVIYKGRIVIVQRYIDGYTVKSNTGNFIQMLESAEYLGRIIQSLKTLNLDLPSNDVSTWLSREAMNESIEKLKNLFAKISKTKYPQIAKDLTDKIFMLKYIKDNFAFKDVGELTIMNTHGDYSVLQFIYKEGKIKAILDFASACKMPIVWEVIRSYSYIDKNAKEGKIDIQHFVKYVKTFTKYVPLNSTDLKYMPYIYLVQLLESSFGYKQYIDDDSKKNLLEFAYFRTRLCRNLFENADEIANVLIKEFERCL